MGTKDVNYFLSAIKYIMVFTGQWDYRNQSNKFIIIYKKIKYFLVFCYSISALVFFSSIITRWKCRQNAIENFFNLMHLVVVLTVTIMLKSKERKIITDFIYYYENVRLKNEPLHSQKIYLQMAKTNNQIVLFFITIATFASVSWFLTGRR